MAASSNYYDSLLLGFQSPVKDEFNKAELRELETQVLNVGLENQDFLMNASEIGRIKQSVNRPVYGYVKNRKPTTSGTAMTAFNTGIGATSSQQTLTWVAFTEEFYFNETEPMDNVFTKDELFKNEMSQAMRNLRERLRTWLTQQLYTNRNAVTRSGNVATSLNTAAGANTFEITGSAATTPWSAMTSTMRWNKYGYSKYDIFADQQMYFSTYEFQQAQATQNGTNLAYQFDKQSIPPQNGGYLNNIWEDIILGDADVPFTGGPYTKGAALCMPSNSFAFIPWMPKIYSDGNGNYDDYAGGYGMVSDDSVPGMDYMVHGWRTQADTTAASGHGYTQDSVTQWQIGFYIAYITQYISVSGETPIYFFAMV